MSVAMASVLKNKNPEDEIYFYVLDGGISEKNRQKILKLKSIADFEIEFIKVDKAIFETCPIRQSDHISRAAYYRLILPGVCSGEDKLLYLDCDIVVKDTLADLFETELDDCYMAMVEDVSALKHEICLGLKQYCNNGVMVIDTEKWRRDSIGQKCLEYIRNNQEILLYHEQDALNILFEDRIKLLDKTWNAQVSSAQVSLSSGFNELGKTAKVIHFVGPNKPWSHKDNPFGHLYFEYLELTPWRYWGLYKRFTRALNRMIRG
jgi:lipopolysaccharide biosynthesis glycosyltransferase